MRRNPKQWAKLQAELKRLKLAGPLEATQREETAITDNRIVPQAHAPVVDEWYPIAQIPLDARNNSKVKQ